jgi:hypothetical protein
MARLELCLSLELQVVRFDGRSAAILGSLDEGVALLDLLSDETDRVSFAEAVKPVIARENAFNTLNLVFTALGAPSVAPKADRSPLNVPHAFPARDGFHSGSEVQLSCFTRIELSEDEEGLPMIKLVAIEYSREHRKDLVRQEIGSWLVHSCVDKQVVAAKPSADIVFWNEHASEKNQRAEQEALERDVSTLFVDKSKQLPQQAETESTLRKEEYDDKLKSSFQLHVTYSKSSFGHSRQLSARRL